MVKGVSLVLMSLLLSWDAFVCLLAHMFAGVIGRNVTFAQEFDTTVNRAYCNYKKSLAGK